MIGYVDILHLLLLYFSFENTTVIQILKNETLFFIFYYVHGY
jgi:CCR4-NOT transcriptional regulation complex NOT5 subunit